MSERLRILQHALGLNKHGQGNSHRNHFVTGPSATDWPHCLAAVADGLMTQTRGSQITGDDDVFRVTESGRAWVAEHSPAPPKLTRSQRRYRAWLAADCNMRFGDWLRSKWGRLWPNT